MILDYSELGNVKLGNFSQLDIRFDKKWNKEWDCANEYWSPFARYVDDGGAAVSTYYRDYIDYHFFLVTMGPKYPSPDEDDYKVVTMHEYFHIYQKLMIFPIISNK